MTIARRLIYYAKNNAKMPGWTPAWVEVLREYDESVPFEEHLGPVVVPQVGDTVWKKYKQRGPKYPAGLTMHPDTRMIIAAPVVVVVEPKEVSQPVQPTLLLEDASKQIVVWEVTLAEKKREHMGLLWHVCTTAGVQFDQGEYTNHAFIKGPLELVQLVFSHINTAQMKCTMESVIDGGVATRKRTKGKKIVASA